MNILKYEKDNQKLTTAINLAEQQMNIENLFIKNDFLIQNHNLNNILDIRLFNTLLYLLVNKEHIQRTNMQLFKDENNEYYKMSIKYSELRKILQFNSKKGFYSFLKKSIFSLSQPFKFEKNGKVIITSLLWRSEFDKLDINGNPERYNEIKFLLDKKMIDEIITGSETFTILDIEKLNSFQSLYAVKLAELIIKYNRLLNVRFFKLTLDEFNKMFNTKYKYITHTRNIMENAMKNIKSVFPEFKNLNVIYINNKIVKDMKNINHIDTEEHISFIFEDYKNMKYKKPFNYLKDINAEEII